MASKGLTNQQIAARMRVKRRRERAQEGGKTAGSHQQLAKQNGELQQALFSLRQMYDQAVLERQNLSGQLAARDQLITAIAAAIENLTFDKSFIDDVQAGIYLGYEVQPGEDDMVVVVAVEAEEVNDEGPEDDDGDQEDE